MFAVYVCSAILYGQYDDKNSEKKFSFKCKYLIYLTNGFFVYGQCFLGRLLG